MRHEGGVGRGTQLSIAREGGGEYLNSLDKKEAST